MNETAVTATDRERAESLQALRDLLGRLVGRDAIDRLLTCTPCGGLYERPAAWVVAVNGSPPRGVFHIGQGRYVGHGDDVFFVLQDRCRRLGRAQAAIVRRFERAYLSPAASIDKLSPFSIPAVPVNQRAARPARTPTSGVSAP